MVSEEYYFGGGCVVWVSGRSEILALVFFCLKFEVRNGMKVQSRFRREWRDVTYSDRAAPSSLQ